MQHNTSMYSSKWVIAVTSRGSLCIYSKSKPTTPLGVRIAYYKCTLGYKP